MNRGRILLRVFVVLVTFLSVSIISSSPVEAFCSSQCPSQGNCAPGRCTNWIRCCDDPASTCYDAYPNGSCTDPGEPATPGPTPTPTPTPTPPPATCPGASKPSAVTLVSPADKRKLGSNSVNLRWSTTGDYGTGCPTQVNRRYIHVIPWPSSNCPSTLRNYPITFEATHRTWLYFSNNKRFNDLEWNHWYCWQVTKSNGTASSGTKARSQVWAFKTPAPPPPTTPTLDSSTFVSSSITKCSVGDSVSGRLTGTANDTNINNPVGYEINVSYTPPNVTDIAEVRFAIVSNSYLASFPNSGRVTDGDNEYLYLEALEPDLHDPTNLGNVGMRVTNLGTTPTYSMINSNTAPYFGSGSTSGNVTAASGIATLRDIGTNTTVTAGTDSYTIRFNTEIKPTFANGDVTLFVSVLADDGSGGLISHDPQSDRGSYDGNLIYQEVNNWAVDMSLPSVAIQDPVFSSGSDFSVRWDITDNGTIEEVRSYCYFGGPATATIRDITSGNDIAFDGNPKSYSDPDNCYVTSAGVNNRNYQVTSGSLTEDLVFGAYASDNACNVTETNLLGAIPDPWFLAMDQTVSSGGGIQDIEIPDTTTNLTDIGVDLTGNDYLGTYAVISGNVNLSSPVNKVSATGVYASSYNNKNLSPTDLGYANWYTLAVASLGQNETVASTGISTINSNLAGTYGVSANSKYFVRHSGDLSINSGVICNLKAIIVVEGDLTIDPDFTRTASNACLFIVQGDVNITQGQHASNGLTASDAANHDVVEAMFVVNGTFTTEIDPAPTGTVNDALLIRGLVFAENVDLKRILSPAQGTSQPAELFIYDPRHAFYFASSLKVSEFSLREF